MPFTLGIEEEYLLTDLRDGSLVLDPPPIVLKESRKRMGDQVAPEMLRAQIEVATVPCATIAEARVELSRLRRTVASVAGASGMAPVAAGTHPFADWNDSIHTDKQRYTDIVNDLQAVGRRLLICGMHVHVEIPDPELRIDLMNRVTPYLPLLLALSTSSPFWRGRDTGLHCYRLAVYDELPRTGLPEPFAGMREYQAYVDTLVEAGIIPDASMIWWAIRPSLRFPTLELRVADSTTRLDDVLSIAALYQCLLRMLWRRRDVNAHQQAYVRLLVDENRWRAQRYGIDRGLLDIANRRLVPMAEYLDQVLDLVAEDADALDCKREVEGAREIIGRGSSAHQQRAVFEAALARGVDRHQALREVVAWLQRATVEGLED